MAEDIAVKVVDQEQVRDPLRELNEELALADHYRYKNKKLIESLPSFRKDKADSLADDYRQAVEDLNRKAKDNTRSESYLMTDFTREVQEFNDLLLNFGAVLKILRKQILGAEK